MLAYEYLPIIKPLKGVKPFSSVCGTSVFLFNRRNFFFQTPLLMLSSPSHIHLQVETRKRYASAGWLTVTNSGIYALCTQNLSMNSVHRGPQSLELFGSVTVKTGLWVSMFVVVFFHRWVLQTTPEFCPSLVITTRGQQGQPALLCVWASTRTSPRFSHLDWWWGQKSVWTARCKSAVKVTGSAEPTRSHAAEHKQKNETVVGIW